MQGDMQTRNSLLTGDRPTCQVDPTHAIDRHGKYDRYADCHEQIKSKRIPRFLCRPCGHTISVLPDDTLPYRPVSVGLVEGCFDAEASGQPQAPVTPTEEGCLKRAWHRFTQRIAALTAVLGQILQTRNSDARRIWIQLRRLDNLEEILRLLSRKFKTSLLGDYQCLKPWSPKDP